MTLPRKLLISTFLIAGLSQAADPALVELVMPDAAVVIGINVARIKSSAIGQSIAAQIQPTDTALKQLVELTGFDPLRDLDEILIAVPPGKSQGRGLVLLRGSFDPSRLPALAQLGDVRLTTFQGVRIASIQQQDPFALACLSNSLALAGDPESVRAAIARRRSASPLDPGLLAKVSQLSETYDLWLVAMIPVADLAGELPDPNLSGIAGEMLKSIKQASGGIKLGTTLEVSLELVTSSYKDALALRDVLKFFTGLALTQAKPTQAADLLDNLRLTVEGTSLKLQIEIPEQQIARMIQAQKQAKAPQPPKPAASEIVIYSTSPEAGGAKPAPSANTSVVRLPAPK